MNSLIGFPKPVILYVDDEPDNLSSFKALFRRDYIVRSAESAQEALDILHGEEVHVLVTDQRMPRMSGAALLEQAALEFPDMLRYMLTGYSDYNPLVDAINKGQVHGYFSKPLNPKEFSERVGKGLENFLLRERNKKLLAELQKSQAQLKQAHALAHIGVWSWDLGKDEIIWSEELWRISGHSPGFEPLSLARLSEFFVQESIDHLQDAVESALKSGEPYQLELEMLHEDQSVRWLYAFGGPVRDERGAITHLHGTLQDITERKQAEIALRKALDRAESANRAKTEFLANMSHEIRTPVNGVMGMLQLMQKSTQDAKQEELAGIAIQSCKRLTSLMSDILDLSRIEVGKMELAEEEMSVPELMLSVAQLFNVAASQKNLALRFDNEQDIPPVVLGDAVRMRQILNNLVGNAIKFTETGSVVATASRLPTTHDERCWILFTISDTGIGIRDEMLQDMFKPFTQAESSYTRRYQGAGLGLAIVKQLVQLMGGAIAVESEERVGTTVYVSIPFRRVVSEETRP
jgi:PAS domain S-box-containing protein